MTEQVKVEMTSSLAVEDVVSTQKTIVVFILDESGSMEGQRNDVIGGFNTYIDALTGDRDQYRVALVKFNSYVAPMWEGKRRKLSDLPRLTPGNYRPSGSTALLDAIGETLTRLAPAENEKYVVIIMTDGEENASRTWKLTQVKDAIAQREKQGIWTFVFIGADIDAFAEAGAMGLVYGNTFQYNSLIPGETTRTFTHLAASTSGYAASTATATADFNSFDKASVTAGGSNTAIAGTSPGIAPFSSEPGEGDETVTE